jgi:hypothetical protein
MFLTFLTLAGIVQDNYIPHFQAWQFIFCLHINRTYRSECWDTGHIHYRPFFYVHMTVHRDMWPCIVTNFLIIKPTRCTNFSKFILEMKLYMFRTVPLSIITVHTAMVYVIQICRQLSSRIRVELCSILILLLLESCLQTCMTYNHCWVYSE